MSAPIFNEWSGRNVAVIGLAATGLATARVLRDRGAQVRVYDAKPPTELDAVRVADARALGDGVTLALGETDIDWAATDLIVPSPGVPRYAAPLAEAVRRGVPILGEIEVAYRLCRAPILAVTGTNGKTTTAALLGAICREAGRETWVAGNIAEDAGKRLPLIEVAVDASADAVIVAEISSFQLEWTERFRPKVGAWLNLSPDHLDRHKDMDEYARAKSNLFRAQEPDDVAVLNADDPAVLQYGRGVGMGEEWNFSVAGAKVTRGAFLQDDLLWATGIGPDKREFTLMEAAESPLPGRHNIANVLAAASVALAFGINADAVRAGVKGFNGVAHRMELVATRGGVRYINNSMCTNPAAVSASVSAVNGPLVVIAGGKHKGGDLSGMARAIAAHARRAVLIGEAATVLANELRAAGLSDVELAGDMDEAVHLAQANAQNGDTVMLAPGCASFDMYAGFEARGQAFRDAVKNKTGGDGEGN